MNVYFVRHGRSILNKLTPHRHQFPDTPLSDHGLTQADAVAKRFAHIPVDMILTSSYTRALQTAQAIEKVTLVPLKQTDILIERVLPTTFQGKAVYDPEIVPIHQAIRDHSADTSWHHSDEENFAELVARGREALAYISSEKGEHIVVVTHGYFLTIMIATILLGENINYPIIKSFNEHTSYANTGLTLCEYIEGKWKLLTWNDYAHLGE